MKTIAPADLAEAMRTSAVDLLDVRTPVEFGAVHVEGSTSIPLDGLDPAAALAARRAPPGAPVYLICRSGVRSQRARERFEAAGADVVCVEGGLDAWAAAGLPVVRGRGAISLERQVRIAAGGAVLAGSLLALFVAARWAWLPAAVGSGLVFAGVTDRCGLSLVLARMPWNR